MTKTKKIAFLGMGIALYVVLGLVLQLPIFANSHLQTDLGYVAFGVYCVCFGWLGAVVGVIGCLLESVLTCGWIPVGWMLGQAIVGLMVGYTCKKTKNTAIWIIVTALAMFIGIGLVKTIIECALFNIPFAVKFTKNLVAFVFDLVPMTLGLGIGKQLKNRI